MFLTTNWQVGGSDTAKSHLWLQLLFEDGGRGRKIRTHEPSIPYSHVIEWCCQCRAFELSLVHRPEVKWKRPKANCKGRKAGHRARGKMYYWGATTPKGTRRAACRNQPPIRTRKVPWERVDWACRTRRRGSILVGEE